MRATVAVLALGLLAGCDFSNQPPPENSNSAQGASSVRQLPPCLYSQAEDLCVCPPLPNFVGRMPGVDQCQAPAGMPGYCVQKGNTCMCFRAGCVAGTSNCICAPNLRGTETCATEGAHCCMDPTTNPSQCQCVYGVPGHLCPAGQSEVPSCGIADLKIMAQMKGFRVVGACMPLVQ